MYDTDYSTLIVMQASSAGTLQTPNGGYTAKNEKHVVMAFQLVRNDGRLERYVHRR